MKIDLNIQHTCHSLAEFTKLSAAIAALLSEFSAGAVASAPHVAPATVLRPDATIPLPPAPVARTDTAAPMVADAVAPAETSGVPAAFAAALDEPVKRKRRTKAEMLADAEAEAAKAAPVAVADKPWPPSAPPAPTVDIFAAPAAVPAPVAVQQPVASPAPAQSAADRQSLKQLVMRLFDMDGGDAKVEAVLNRYGGSISKVPDDKIGACAIDLGAAIRGA